MHGHARTTLPSGVVVHSWSPAAPARAAVVVQHGFGEYAERFVGDHGRLVPQLLGQGYQVWAMDLWGHGRSPGRRGAVHVGRAVDDHIALRTLAAGTLPVLLLGHSLGGLITAASAALDPDGVAGVVLLSPALPRREPAVVRRMVGAAARVRPGTLVPRPRRPLSELSRDPAVAVRAAQDDIMVDSQISVLVAATALDVMDRLQAAARSWAHPTLVIHGTGDTYTDPAASSAFVEHLPAPDVRLHLIPGAFHELLADLCADDVRALVLEWAAERA